MQTRSFWLAIIAGVTAGAGIALLFAPQTGTKTRKQLKRSLEDASDYLEDASDYLKSQAEKLSSDAQSALKRGKGYVGDATDSATDLASTAVKRAKSLV